MKECIHAEWYLLRHKLCETTVYWAFLTLSCYSLCAPILSAHITARGIEVALRDPARAVMRRQVSWLWSMGQQMCEVLPLRFVQRSLRPAVGSPTLSLSLVLSFQIWRINKGRRFSLKIWDKMTEPQTYLGAGALMGIFTQTKASLILKRGEDYSPQVQIFLNEAQASPEKLPDRIST